MSRLVSNFARNSHGVRSGERYGIEVEGEGCPFERAGELDWGAGFLKFWTMTSDGSLRNGGIEFVSKPLTRLQVPSAIDAMWPYIHSGRVRPSVRTGVHIHASCLGLDLDHVTRILQHYALLEPLLFAAVGPAREENIYCIPWYRATDEPEEVREFISRYNGNENSAMDRGPCKYSALFVGPLTQFGTIEFRHAPTWGTARQMHQWFDLVRAVWGTHETTYDVLEQWRRLGPVDFARSVAPFDWLPPVPEDVYLAADVEYVASLLTPPKPLVTAGWGRAPELRAKGTATSDGGALIRRPRARAPETSFDAMLESLRAETRLRRNLGLTTAEDTLTVNAGDAVVAADMRQIEERVMAQRLMAGQPPEEDFEEFDEEYPEDDEDEDDFTTEPEEV